MSTTDVVILSSTGLLCLAVVFVAALYVAEFRRPPIRSRLDDIIAEGGDPDAIEAEYRAALERAIREAEAARAAGKAAAGRLPALGSFW